MTATATLPPLTVFHAWLVVQPRTRVIGQRLDCLDCPLVAWLRTVCGELAQVDEETIQIGTAHYETPEAYKQVLQAIDYCAYAHGTGSAVTVEECLWILKDMGREGGA